ncbi:DNA polymerase III subunit delta [Desulfoplanes formicivorans]|uniref:DNA polymerase III subunit delta n=1 Tax=Desulfoplanes formicivorans TaxID=1592317 RepID=UPI00114D21E9|nr:DNA polymerase III subunit delta [Desulfoplanes formicivorans]
MIHPSSPSSSQNQRPGFSFCVCPDPERLREHIRLCLEHTKTDWENKVFWGDEDISPAFWQALSVPNLMGPPRALILRRAHGLKVDFWKSLTPHLKGFKQSIWPFFCLEGAWSKNKPAIPKTIQSRPYWKVATRKKWIWQDPGLTRSNLPETVRRWAGSRQIQFEPGVLQAFCHNLPLETFALHNELEKLSLHLGTRKTVTLSDLTLFEHPMDMDMFTFLRSIQDKRQCLQSWKKILVDQGSTGSDMLFPFLGLLTWETRTMWQLAAGEDKAVRLPPSIKSMKKNMATRLGLIKLSRIFDLIADAETSVKSGRQTPDQALAFTVQELMRTFS